MLARQTGLTRSQVHNTLLVYHDMIENCSLCCFIGGELRYSTPLAYDNVQMVADTSMF